MSQSLLKEQLVPLPFRPLIHPPYLLELSVICILCCSGGGGSLSGCLSSSGPFPQSCCGDEKAVSGHQTPAGPCPLAHGPTSCQDSLGSHTRRRCSSDTPLTSNQDPEGRGLMPTSVPRHGSSQGERAPRPPVFPLRVSRAQFLSPHVFQDPRFLFAQRPFPDSPFACLLASGNPC